MLGLPNAELFLVDGVELPESDVVLKRRVLIGIRDWELRLDVPIEIGEDGRSRVDERSVPYILDVGGPVGTPVKSLLVRRWIFVGGFGICFSILISSNDGMTFEYQAEGDDGEPLET